MGMDYIVKLSVNETQECKRLALMEGRDKRNLWTETPYRRGFVSYNTFLGCVGEKSVSKTFFDGKIDESISFIGDGGKDFTYGKTHLDVKAQVSEATWAVKNRGIYGGFYVIATDKNNREKKLKYDMVFFVVVDSLLYNNRWYKYKIKKDILKKDWENVSAINMEICGYIWKEDILKNKYERIGPTLYTSKNGNSYNYYIKKEELILPLSVENFKSILRLGRISE
jgi:hypothetical protein